MDANDRNAAIVATASQIRLHDEFFANPLGIPNLAYHLPNDLLRFAEITRNVIEYAIGRDEQMVVVDERHFV